MYRLVIVGAGISGLAAARRAANQAKQLKNGLQIMVLERESEVGGKARTLHVEGWRVETGPTGYLAPDPVLDELVEAANLDKSRQPAEAAAAHRFIVRGGRMREVVAHPLKFMTSGLLGPLGILRLLAEPLIPPHRDGHDESVWDFAARRIGCQAADRLIAPMVLGIFAGDAKQLSLPAAFPRLAALEAEHGSLIRGMLARRRSGSQSGGPAGPGGWLSSFQEGLQMLPHALADTDDFIVRCDAQVQTVTARPGGCWEIKLTEEDVPLAADAVVLAGEPWSMARLLPETAKPLAQELEAIVCPPVAVVAMGFKEQDVVGLPKGFGVLIPRGEGYRILGCLWDSHIFPGRSPDGHVLVRAMVGGTVDPEIALLPGSRLRELVYQELLRLLQIRARPVFEYSTLWPRAIPQYHLGHLDRVKTIEQELGRLPGLFLAGNSLYGIPFGKAAAQGAKVGEAAMRWLMQSNSSVTV
jgi:oxygen-dependent protoporphyrinogen oxidase